MTKYAFLTQYKDQTGVFVAVDIKQASEMAWDSLKVMIPEPDPSWFVVRPMTQKMIDEWDGAPLEHFESFSPWPEQSYDDDTVLLAAFDTAYGEIEAFGDDDKWHSWLGIWSLAWGAARSYYTGPSRPATRTEVEAMTAICNLQDELQEAREIIRSLLRARIRPDDMPEAGRKAIEYLKPKPPNVVADGDE